MRVCWICGATAFVLGILGVIFVWPFLQNLWSGSYSGYNAGYTGYDNYGGYNGNGGYSGNYGGYSGDYGGNGGYGGGYGGGTTYATWGQPTYYRPRRPPPCYSPCY